MAKVALVSLYSLVLVMLIRTAIAENSPAPAHSSADSSSIWSSMADKVGSVFSKDDDDDQGSSPSPTGAIDQIHHAPGPAYVSMRGSAQAFASHTSHAAEAAKKETSTWGGWFKDKIGAMNIFGGKSNSETESDAPAAAPSA
ncbi:hypothetical protein SAY87_004503 [Trapa incisa]|uniref:Uncharacterized protein n=1 Tax=Trapa incisa TaxID=236973 RepID=A0AAN7PM61_9MYRT|nr:hypothetical protein SAY87_004503 [Trapa incisa]